MNRSARAVFVGCGGRAGATFKRFIEAGGTIVGMFDPSDESIAKFGAPPDTPRFETLDRMLRSVDADAAFISSPNVVHAEQFIACAEAGLHTWVEKPIAITLDEALAMRDAAGSAGIMVAIPFATNEDALERDAVELVRRGDLGPLVQLTMVRTCGAGFHVSGGRHYAVEKPEVSGGWIAHHLCHMIDFAMEVGGPIDRVYCQTATTIEHPRPHQEESIATVLHYASGGTATLCDNQCGHQQTQTIISGHRGAWISRVDKMAIRQRSSEVLCAVDLTVDGNHKRVQWTPDEYRAYAARRPTYVRQFLEAVVDGGPWSTTIDRGVNVMRVYLACQESERTSEAVAVETDL